MLHMGVMEGQWLTLGLHLLKALPVSAWPFLPQSKDMLLRLIDGSKLGVGVNGCLSLCVRPAVNW